MINFEEILEQNKGLIYDIAKNYSNYYSIEDLYQVGCIGLLKAYNNYKKDNNTKFSTYAYKYIFGEIIKFIRNDRTMRVSSDSLKIYKSYEKSKEVLTNKLNRIPSIYEISSFMGIPINILESSIKESEFTLSLDSVLCNDDYTLDKLVGTDNRREIDLLIDLKSELEELTSEERKLIELRYFKDYTQSETAEYLGMSQVQVSRNEKLILKRIEKSIA